MHKLMTLKTWFFQSAFVLLFLGILLGAGSTADERAQIWWMMLIVVPTTCAVLMLAFSLLMWSLPKGKQNE